MFIARQAAIQAAARALEAHQEVHAPASLSERVHVALNDAYVTAVAHPFATSLVSVGASVVTVLQSAQEIVGTLIALAASLTSLALGVVAMVGAVKKAIRSLKARKVRKAFKKAAEQNNEP